MSLDPSFGDLIRRVRARDGQAAEELLRRYEPALRVAARVRLTDPNLRRWLDSMDICQSVFLNFFVRVASGQFQLETPEQLLKLLATMAHNKLTNYALHQRAACRDQRRVQKGGLEEDALIDPGPSVSRAVTPWSDWKWETPTSAMVRRRLEAGEGVSRPPEFRRTGKDEEKGRLAPRTEPREPVGAGLSHFRARRRAASAGATAKRAAKIENPTCFLAPA